MKTQKHIVIMGGLAVFAVSLIVFTACEDPTEPAHVHQWSEWDVTPATCVETGSKTRTCALDATHTETEVIPIDLVNGHDWDEWEGTVTCTTTGSGTRVCSRSEAHIEERDDLPPLGHNYQNWMIITAPTCTTAGEETGTCTHDNSHTTTRTVAIDPNAHVWGEWDESIVPTCTTTGQGSRVCTLNDQHTEIGATIPALGHDYQNWIETTAPTCTTAGIETGTCTHDATHTDTRAVAIDPDAHDWNTTYITISAATETTDGIEAVTCKHNASHTKEPRFNGEYATGTAGLAFISINNNTAYRVYNGSVTSGVVHIPAYYRPNADSQYLPVTDITTDGEMYGAFFNTAITAVHISANVTFIGDAFSNCTSLANVTFAEGIQLQIIQGFTGCSSLTSIAIPESVTNIGRAFPDCTNLTSVIFAEGSQLETIGQEAFSNCTSLTSITIPAGVTSIGGSAFYGCVNLSSINIPASVTSIGGDAFSNCTSLTGITVDNGNTNYSSEGGILYNKAKTILIKAFPTGINGSITIPASVTTIGFSAFSDCANLSSINIPASVTSIGNSAFSNCTSLTEITFPEGVTAINGTVFFGCSNLTTITVSSSLTNISGAIEGRSEDNWLLNNLAFFICPAVTPPTMQGYERPPFPPNENEEPEIVYSTFDYTPNVQIKVPAGSVAAYKAAPGWSKYADRISAIE